MTWVQIGKLQPPERIGPWSITWEVSTTTGEIRRISSHRSVWDEQRGEAEYFEDEHTETVADDDVIVASYFTRAFHQLAPEERATAATRLEALTEQQRAIFDELVLGPDPDLSACLDVAERLGS